MSYRDREESYTGVQIFCHWIIAVFCLVEFPTASSIQRIHIGHVFGIPPRPYDVLSASAHESIGLSLLLLTSVLAISRVIQGTPSLPSGMARWQRWLAHIAHVAIYTGLFTIIASGLATAYFDGRIGSLHALLTRIGVGLIALHVSAAFWHQLLRRDGLLNRMLPKGKSRAR